MARTTYVAGPGVVIRSSRAIFTKGDIKIVEAIASEPIEVAYYGGVVDFRSSDRSAIVSFEPAGEFESSDIAQLYPHSALTFGGDLFPASDVPLKIYGADGNLRTYAASAVTKQPPLSLGMKKHPFGTMEILCLGTGDTDWSTANSLVQIQTGQSVPTEVASGDTLALADLVRAYAVGNWPSTGASAPWLNFTSVDGFEIDPQLKLYDKENDRYGRQNLGIEGIDVTCTFKPSGPTETEIQTAMGYQGASAARGASLNSLSLGDLAVAVGTTPRKLTATVKGAVITEAELAYGLRTPRVNRVTMKATCTTFGATIGNYFTVAIS